MRDETWGRKHKKRIFIYKHIFMRYKNNVIDKLGQLEAVASRIQIQASRGATQEQVLESIEMLKEQINSIREIISIEADDFEQQFAPGL